MFYHNFHTSPGNPISVIYQSLSDIFLNGSKYSGTYDKVNLLKYDANFEFSTQFKLKYKEFSIEILKALIFLINIMKIKAN